MRTATDRYTGPAITLHWLIAALIIALIGVGWYMTDLPKGPDRSWFFGLHKSLGLTAALLIIARVAWRISHAAPALPAFMPSLQVKLAKASHHLLYVCMVVMPTTGYLASSFTKYPIKFFGLPLPSWGWEDKALNTLFDNIHSATANVLVALIALHLAAALKHLLVDRDGVFHRMLP